MITQTQRNQEKIELLLQLLVAENVITEYEKELIANCRTANEAKELADGLAERRN